MSLSQSEIHPYPSNLRSGWLPPYGSDSMRKFFEAVLAAERKPFAPSIEAMREFIDSDPVVREVLDEAIRQNGVLLDADLSEVERDGVPLPRIKDPETLLHAFNEILSHAPTFIDDALVGLPFSALVVGIDPTLAGSALFSLPEFNKRMAAILNEWNSYLASADSASGFSEEGQGWLSPTAKQQYQFDDWQKDQERLPYWTSWNSFFTREFKDSSTQRPIADPDSNRTAICPNDGSLFRWDERIKRTDAFWFKDMNYSLSDILSSTNPEQQAVIDDYGLVDLFEGGYILQTYLNPYNFHRWWVPANGEVLFDPLVVPGFFFKKLVLPDFGGATTASLPYLAQVNARGIVVFKTPDYGHICCIPLGMSETSTITFDDSIRAGARVQKGDPMGTFNYGGSSFAILYQDLPDKQLIFESATGVPYPKRPVLPTSSSGTGGIINNIGSQLGAWYSKDK